MELSDLPEGTSRQIEPDPWVVDSRERPASSKRRVKSLLTGGPEWGVEKGESGSPRETRKPPGARGLTVSARLSPVDRCQGSGLR